LFNNVEENAKEMNNISKSITYGNNQIKIISHDFLYKSTDNEKHCIGAIFKIKNISGAIIGQAVICTSFYNSEGDIIDTVEYAFNDLLKDGERVIRIESVKVDINNFSIDIKDVVLTPEPLATGNDDIVILSHHIQDPDVTARGDKRSIDMAIRNISDKTFATVLFEAVFYDSIGNIMSKTKHREYEFQPNISRGIHIIPDKHEPDNFKSYKVSIMRALTTDVEKVQLRRHEIRSIDGGEEIRGSVKNLSDVKTDTTLIATFKDSSGEKIGTKVIILKDIEPHSVKPFQFVFNTPIEEKVREYVLNLGELIEES